MATPSCGPYGNARPGGGGAWPVGAGCVGGSGVEESIGGAGQGALGTVGAVGDGGGVGCLDWVTVWFARHVASWSVGRMLYLVIAS